MILVVERPQALAEVQELDGDLAAAGIGKLAPSGRVLHLDAKAADRPYHMGHRRGLAAAQLDGGLAVLDLDLALAHRVGHGVVIDGRVHAAVEERLRVVARLVKVQDFARAELDRRAVASRGDVLLVGADLDGNHDLARGIRIDVDVAVVRRDGVVGVIRVEDGRVLVTQRLHHQLVARDPAHGGSAGVLGSDTDLALGRELAVAVGRAHGLALAQVQVAVGIVGTPVAPNGHLVRKLEGLALGVVAVHAAAGVPRGVVGDGDVVQIQRAGHPDAAAVLGSLVTRDGAGAVGTHRDGVLGVDGTARAVGGRRVVADRSVVLEIDLRAAGALGHVDAAAARRGGVALDGRVVERQGGGVREVEHSTVGRGLVALEGGARGLELGAGVLAVHDTAVVFGLVVLHLRVLDGCLAAPAGMVDNGAASLPRAAAAGGLCGVVVKGRARDIKPAVVAVEVDNAATAVGRAVVLHGAVRDVQRGAVASDVEHAAVAGRAGSVVGARRVAQHVGALDVDRSVRAVGVDDGAALLCLVLGELDVILAGALDIEGAALGIHVDSGAVLV